MANPLQQADRYLSFTPSKDALHVLNALGETVGWIDAAGDPQGTLATGGGGGGGQATSVAIDSPTQQTAPTPTGTNPVPAGQKTFLWIKDSAGNYQPSAQIDLGTSFTEFATKGFLSFNRPVIFNKGAVDPDFTANGALAIFARPAANDGLGSQIEIETPAGDTTTYTSQVTGLYSEFGVQGDPTLTGVEGNSALRGSINDERANTSRGASLSGLAGAYFRNSATLDIALTKPSGVRGDVQNNSNGDLGVGALLPAFTGFANNFGNTAQGLGVVYLAAGIGAAHRFPDGNVGFYADNSSGDPTDFAVYVLSGPSRFRSMCLFATTKSSNYTLTIQDNFISATGTTSITLPDLGDVPDNIEYIVRNDGVATVTIVGTIDGVTNPTLIPNQALAFRRINTTWHSIGIAGPIVESQLSLSDVTTNNASTSKHGFLPKLDGNATHFLSGTGVFSTPGGGGGGGNPVSGNMVGVMGKSPVDGGGGWAGYSFLMSFTSRMLVWPLGSITDAKVAFNVTGSGTLTLSGAVMYTVNKDTRHVTVVTPITWSGGLTMTPGENLSDAIPIVLDGTVDYIFAARVANGSANTSIGIVSPSFVPPGWGLTNDNNLDYTAYNVGDDVAVASNDSSALTTLQVA